MVTQDMRDDVYDIVRQNITAARLYYGQHFDIPTINFKLRGRTAGRAHLSQWRIDINPILLAENTEEMTTVTVPHEVAHLIDYKINPNNFNRKYGKRSVHGHTFKFILGKVLGCHDVSTTHTMDTSNARVRPPAPKFVWISDQTKTEMPLGKKRHEKMMSGITDYWMSGTSNETYTFSHTTGNHIKQVQHKLTPTRTTSKTTKKTTKKELSKAIFTSTNSRQEFIRECVAQLHMTASGASTYHSNFKRNVW